MERENAQEDETQRRHDPLVSCNSFGGVCENAGYSVVHLHCGGDASPAWSQYLDDSNTDTVCIFMTPASRLFARLAILAGRQPCKQHPHLKIGFTATGWLWREYLMCSASGWMVSRVQFGEWGGTWSECAATNETPTTRSRRAKQKRSLDGDTHKPTAAAVDQASVSHGTTKKPSRKRKKVETQAQSLLPCT